MCWRIRRIVNGYAAQQLVARQNGIAPEFISYGLVIRQDAAASRRGLIQVLSKNDLDMYA